MSQPYWLLDLFLDVGLYQFADEELAFDSTGAGVLADTIVKPSEPSSPGAQPSEPGVPGVRTTRRA